ncbi:MAG TPA: ATP-binding protein [Salinivirgaceae bacterium]|nr:ATP-binding protein [Salinivirgaceae bacterium]
MKKHYIEQLIEEGEHQQQDFKFAINDAKKIARSLVAFANTEGGRLLIGVKDNGKIAGVRSEEEIHMLEAAIELYTRPKIKAVVKPWNVHGKSVIEVTILPGKSKPYYAPDEHNCWKAYLRKGDTNIIANELVVESWKRKRSQKGILMKLNKEHQDLINFLKEHGEITLMRYSRIAKISSDEAKKILIDLMVLDIIEYASKDNRTIYVLKNLQNR